MAEPLGVFYGSGVSMWLNHLGLIWYQSGLGVVAEPLMMGFIFSKVSWNRYCVTYIL